MTLSNSQLSDPVPVPLPPTRAEIAAAQRATSIEAAKDKWNAEVLNAVRWVQHTDWDEVRGGLEDTASGLWKKAFGESISDSAEEAKAKLEAATQKARQEAEKKRDSIAATAKGTWQQAKEKAEQVELTAEDKALEARLKGKKTLEKTEKTVEQKAVEAKGAIASALEAGQEAATGLIRNAKAAVGIVESKVEGALSGDKLPGLNPVQKALQQRYEHPEAKNNKTVAEVLRERYLPVEQRDNTVLRGV